MFTNSRHEKCSFHVCDVKDTAALGRGGGTHPLALLPRDGCQPLLGNRLTSVREAPVAPSPPVNSPAVPAAWASPLAQASKGEASSPQCGGAARAAHASGPEGITSDARAYQVALGWPRKWVRNLVCQLIVLQAFLKGKSIFWLGFWKIFFAILHAQFYPVSWKTDTKTSLLLMFYLCKCYIYHRQMKKWNSTSTSFQFASYEKWFWKVLNKCDGCTQP